jgi:hypothetical protein
MQQDLRRKMRIVFLCNNSLPRTYHHMHRNMKSRHANFCFSPAGMPSHGHTAAAQQQQQHSSNSSSNSNGSSSSAVATAAATAAAAAAAQ